MSGQDAAYEPPPFHPMLAGRRCDRLYLPAEEVTALLRWYATDRHDAAPEVADLLGQIADDLDCTLIDWMSRQELGLFMPSHDMLSQGEKAASDD